MNISLEPRILRWARERAGLDVSALAKKLGIKKVGRVTEWERTGEMPYEKAELLAEKTYTPFGFLFLKEPPDEALPIPDFRTVASAPVRQPSPNLLDTIYRAQHRQNWFRDYLSEEGHEPLAWVGSLRLSDRPVEAANRVREVTGLTTALRRSASNWEDALRLMVEQIEESGVLVMRNGVVDNNVHRKLSVDEFRGFALADPHAPLIFVNGADALGAQMFTLAHELIHIGLGLSGVSTLEATFSNGRDTEKFCNEVAAELLIPLAELREDELPARRQFRKFSSFDNCDDGITAKESSLPDGAHGGFGGVFAVGRCAGFRRRNDWASCPGSSVPTLL